MGRPLSPSACCGAKSRVVGNEDSLYTGPARQGSRRLSQRPSIISHFEYAPGRELYFFALYRLLEAGILAGLLFSPLSGLLGEPRAPVLGTAVTIAYLLFALAMFFFGRSERRQTASVLIGVGGDILVAVAGHLRLAAGHGRHRHAAAVQRVGRGAAAAVPAGSGGLDRRDAGHLRGIPVQQLQRAVQQPPGRRSHHVRRQLSGGGLSGQPGRPARALQPGAGRSARRGSGQPVRGQRTDHPPHAHRRAFGRRREPHQAGQRSGFAAARRRPRRRQRIAPAAGRTGAGAAPAAVAQRLAERRHAAAVFPRPAGSAAALRPPAGRQRAGAGVPGRRHRGLAPSRIADPDRAGALLRQPGPRDPQPAGGDQLRRAAAGGIAEHHRRRPPPAADHPPAVPAHQRHRRKRAGPGPPRARQSRTRGPQHLRPALRRRVPAEHVDRNRQPGNRDRRQGPCRRWSTCATCSRC